MRIKLKHIPSKELKRLCKKYETIKKIIIIKKQGVSMKLYYHKTDGGAEYLMNTYIKWSHNGKSGKEGVLNNKTKYVVRIDGDIEKDAELNVRN